MKKDKVTLIQNPNESALMINGRLCQPKPNLMLNEKTGEVTKKLAYDKFKVKTTYAIGVHDSFYNQGNQRLHKYTKNIKKKERLNTAKSKYGYMSNKKVSDSRIMSFAWKQTKVGKQSRF